MAPTTVPSTGRTTEVAADHVLTARLRRRLAVLLWTVTLLLSVASAFAVLLVGRGPVVALFSVGGEANVPAWWSSALLLSAAVVALLVGVLCGPGSQPRGRTWVVAAAVLAGMALDEVAGLHERLGVLADRWAQRAGVELITYSWLGPGLVVLAAVAVLAWRWWRQLPRDVARSSGVAVVLLLFGGVVLEAAAGYMRNLDRVGLMYGFTALEELFEMAGMVLLLLALLRLVVVVRSADGGGSLRLRHDVRGEVPRPPRATAQG